MEKILEVKDLHVSFQTYAGEVEAIRGIDFHVNKGEFVAIVGESGCGKTVTSEAIMGLIPNPPGYIKKGEIYFENEDLVKYSEREMQKIRGKKMGMVFQDPMTSLNPTMTVGSQIAEGLIKHQGLSKKEAKKVVIESLKLVGIPTPEERANQYPHQFSGGMRQRVMIAIALASMPSLLIADEPTTALDVTIQAQILELMKELQEKMGTSTVLITHDLGVVAEVCDRVVVMYAGKVVETGTVDEIFYNPQHPYTEGLLNSIPRFDNKDPLIPITGTPPELLNPPKGCAFASRCEYAMKVCIEIDAELEGVNGEQQAACWLHHPLAREVPKTIDKSM